MILYDGFEEHVYVSKKKTTKQQIMGNGNKRGFRWWLDIK